MTTRVGIDAHKKSCTTCVFGEDALSSPPSDTFVFRTTMQGVAEFMQKVPEGSTIVRVEHHRQSHHTRLLSGRYEVHMISPPERKPAIKPINGTRS